MPIHRLAKRKAESFVLALLLLLAQLVTGQTLVSVLDAESGLGLPRAHVRFSALDGTHLQTVLTNSKGEAVVPADSGQQKWVVEVSYVGFQTHQDTIEQGSSVQVTLLPKLAELGEFVVTAQYGPSTTNDAVHAIRVITAEKIEQMAAVSLEDVLSNELNVRLSQDNVLGSRLSMQGLSGQNVKIMIDGVPIVGRQDGNLDLSQINLQNIERIEIIEGPLSVNFGTDAIAGTINLITRKKQREKWSTKASYYTESIGTYNLQGAANIQLNRFQLGFTAGRNFFDGWNPGDMQGVKPPERIADSSRVQSWKPREQHFGSVQLNWSSKTIDVGYQLRYFDETITNRGAPRAPYQESAFDDRYATTRLDHGLNFSGQIGPRFRLNGVAGFNRYERRKNSWITNLTNLEETRSEAEGSQDTAQFDLWMSRSSVAFSPDSSWIKLELGYDFQTETSSGKRIKGQDQQISDYALFTTAELRPFKNLSLRPGLRAAYNSSYDAPIVPSFNLKYQQNQWTFRTSYARGFRAPGLKELHFLFIDVNHNIQGNEALKAETSNNFSLNIQRRYLFGKSLIRLEGGAFYNDIKNLISLAQVDETLFSYVNIGQYSTRGGKLQTTWNYPGWKIQAGASYTGQYNAISEEEAVDDYSWYPEGSIALYKKLKPIKTQLAFFYKYQGRLPGFGFDSEGKVVETYVDAYQMADVTLTRRFWKSRLGLAIGAKNILNVQNVNAGMNGGTHSSSASSVPISTGRLYFLKLDVKWMRS